MLRKTEMLGTTFGGTAAAWEYFGSCFAAASRRDEALMMMQRMQRDAGQFFRASMGDGFLGAPPTITIGDTAIMRSGLKPSESDDDTPLFGDESIIETHWS